MTKTIENTSTIYTGKFNNPSECVYYMQMTGMSLGDFLKDCANRAKEHYFDTVTGKDLKGLEEIQSSVTDCDALEGLGEITECERSEPTQSVIGEQVPYSDDNVSAASCNMTEYYEDSDEVMDWKYYHIY